MLIKICGITKKKEILFLRDLKPDYIGFVFAESKRKVTCEEVRELMKFIPKESSIKTVAVFRNNSLEYVKKIVDNLDLDVIQFHGDEDKNFINNVKSFTNKEIWKALCIDGYDNGNETKEIEMIEKSLKEFSNVDSFLIDGVKPGSGEILSSNMLKAIGEFMKNYNKKFILAGGINEGNVIEALVKAKPVAVDVSSGVERIDDVTGVREKDKEKVEGFIRKVRCEYEGKI